MDLYGHLVPVMQEAVAMLMDDLVTPIPVKLGEKAELELELVDLEYETIARLLHLKQKACLSTGFRTPCMGVNECENPKYSGAGGN